ncbi:hypothetical protein DFH11DRAFT_1075836 [Phellopilus nigrolimitatus]|nr:hypothetical protein DFH11DRAFT_1075836 [Phellopilus nigrolimitatus]
MHYVAHPSISHSASVSRVFLERKQATIVSQHIIAIPILLHCPQSPSHCTVPNSSCSSSLSHSHVHFTPGTHRLYDYRYLYLLTLSSLSGCGTGVPDLGRTCVNLSSARLRLKQLFYLSFCLLPHGLVSSFLLPFSLLSSHLANVYLLISTCKDLKALSRDFRTVRVIEHQNSAC